LTKNASSANTKGLNNHCQVLGPCSSTSCQFYKKIVLWLSEHGDVIATQQQYYVLTYHATFVPQSFLATLSLICCMFSVQLRCDLQERRGHLFVIKSLFVVTL